MAKDIFDKSILYDNLNHLFIDEKSEHVDKKW